MNENAQTYYKNKNKYKITQILLPIYLYLNVLCAICVICAISYYEFLSFEFSYRQ